MMMMVMARMRKKRIEDCLQVFRHEKLAEAGTGCQADPKYDILHISTYMIWGVTCWYDLGNAQI